MESRFQELLLFIIVNSCMFFKQKFGDMLLLYLSVQPEKCLKDLENVIAGTTCFIR